MSALADGATNLVSNGIYAAASTNVFTLSAIVGANKAGLSLQGPTLNGTQVGASGAFNIGSSSQVGIYTVLPLMTTNNIMVGTNVVYGTNVTVRYAASQDGTLWISNYFSQVFTAVDNSLFCTPLYTNISLGTLQFLCVQAVENNTSSIVTNATIQASTKAGF